MNLDDWLNKRLDRLFRLDDAAGQGEHRRAAELFYLVSSAGLFISALLGVMFLVQGVDWLGAMSLFMSAILLVTRIAVHARWLSIPTAVFIFCLVPLFIVCMNSLRLGGLASPSMVWLPLFTLFSFQMLSRRAAALIGGLSLIAFAVLPFMPTVVELDAAGLGRFRYVTFSLAALFAVALGIGIDRVRRRAIERLEFTNQALARATKDAETASRAKSEFLAMVSHELRTPLHAIMGITDLLSSDDSLPVTHKERTTTARGAAGTLLALVDDLLDLSALDAGRVTLRPLASDIVAIAVEVRELLGIRALDKGIDVIIKVDEPIAPVLVDPMRVRQILSNLVDNAMKFMGAGSITIAISSRPVETGTSQISIAVTDTGEGIPDGRLREIFERFERVDGAAGRTRGVGLGLAITRDLLRLMGGDLVVRSQVGIGSTFTATLHAARVDPDASLQGRRILLADDDVVNQKVAVWLLESLGCSVDLASNGAEAVRLAGLNAYDAILLDCQMPELDGFASARQIRVGAHGTVPILAFTAGDESRDRVRAAGMNDFLQKPVDREGLRAALLRHLGPVDLVKPAGDV